MGFYFVAQVRIHWWIDIYFFKNATLTFGPKKFEETKNNIIIKYLSKNLTLMIIIHDKKYLHFLLFLVNPLICKFLYQSQNV